MATYTNAKRITASKKKCICAETKKTILKNESILYDPKTKKVYSRESKEFLAFRLKS